MNQSQNRPDEFFFERRDISMKRSRKRMGLPLEYMDMPPFPDGGGGGGDLQTPEDRVVRHLGDLRVWSSENRRESIGDFWRYWALKIPAILSSVVSAASATLSFDEKVVSGFAMAAGICVAIDGMWPGGLLHNVHKMAVHEINLLTAEAQTELDKVNIEHPDMSSDRRARMVKILDLISEERSRIGEYIKNAEVSLGVGSGNWGNRK